MRNGVQNEFPFFLFSFIFLFIIIILIAFLSKQHQIKNISHFWREFMFQTGTCLWSPPPEVQRERYRKKERRRGWEQNTWIVMRLKSFRFKNRCAATVYPPIHVWRVRGGYKRKSRRALIPLFCLHAFEEKVLVSTWKWTHPDGQEGKVGGREWKKKTKAKMLDTSNGCSGSEEGQVSLFFPPLSLSHGSRIFEYRKDFDAKKLVFRSLSKCQCEQFFICFKTTRMYLKRGQQEQHTGCLSPLVPHRLWRRGSVTDG